MITIKSIQIGRVRTQGDPHSDDPMKRLWTSAFDKSAIDGQVSVVSDGLIGDEVADRQHHGGPDKAVLCYPASHYRLWSEEYPDHPWPSGAFGENLTVNRTTESDVCLGDRYRAGNALFQVSQPRQPCWKISRRWGIKTLTKRVVQTGRTGWYLRVLHSGQIATGDKLELDARPHPDWTVARANDVLFGREVDRMAVIELMNVAELADAWKQALA